MSDEDSVQGSADQPLESDGSGVPGLGQEAGDGAEAGRARPGESKPRRKGGSRAGRSSAGKPRSKPKPRSTPKPAAEQATVIESDLQVSVTSPAAENFDGTSAESGVEPIATVTRLPVPATPRERSTLMERLERLEQGLAEVDARLDLIMPPEVRVIEIPPEFDDADDTPFAGEITLDEIAAQPASGPAPMTEAEMQDVFLGLQRMVAERIDRGDRKK